jgi:hypothetical protein
MILITGDGFAAASYAAVPFSSANEDPVQYLLGAIPHPKNQFVSFGKNLNNTLHCPFRIEANLKTCYTKIFRETKAALENYDMIKYVVIVWPDFYRGEVWVDNKNIQFTFAERRNFDPTSAVGQAITEFIQSFETQKVHNEFNQMVQELCSIFETKNIIHSMLLSEGQVDALCGNWLFDPKTTNIRSWANTLGYLNNFGYLTVQGHLELSKLLTINLTNNLTNQL